MKYLVFLLILGFSAGVSAQTMLNKQVLCMDPATIIKALTGEDIQEKIYWVGKSDVDDSKYALFVNTKTKKWTFVQMNDQMACIVGSGDKATTVHEFKPIKQ